MRKRGRSRRKDTSLGIEENIEAMLSYVAGWVSGLVIFLLEKDNKFVRFHALQSIITFGGLTILYSILSPLWMPFLFFIMFYYLLSFFSLGLWILLMIKAYNYEMFKLPVIGEVAEKYA